LSGLDVDFKILLAIHLLVNFYGKAAGFMGRSRYDGKVDKT
jgi:hypothetical protein